MRLSDVKGERTFDVIADIIDPIANIAEDKDAADLFTRQKLPDGMTANQFLLQRARKAVPALLKNHKADVIAILSTIEGVTTDEYCKELNLAKLFVDCVELITDQAFTAFFPSAQSREGETLSGSALDNSTDEESGPLSDTPGQAETSET